MEKPPVSVPPNRKANGVRGCVQVMAAGYAFTVLASIANVILGINHFRHIQFVTYFLLLAVTVNFGWAVLRSVVVLIIECVRDLPTLGEVATLVAVMVLSVFGLLVATVMLGTFSDAFPK